MKNIEKNNSEIHLCSKCGREIPFGSSYYSITRQLEFLSKNPDTNELEIEVKEAEELISLCKSCGGVFNHDSLIIILKNLPTPGHEIRN